MNEIEFKKIVIYLVEQGLAAIQSYAGEEQAKVDYAAIFSRDDDEFRNLEIVAQSLGVQVDEENIKTGKTFLLNEPMETSAGELKFVKVRIPDKTRPQRGAPDFKIPDYAQFKEKYLQTSGNFTLMIRKDYEMIEIKGVDVLVYIPSNTLTERLSV